MATRHSDFSVFDRIGDTTHRLTLACLGLIGSGTRTGGALIAEALKTGQNLGHRLTGGLDDTARTIAGPVIKQAEDFIELRVTRLLNSFQVPTSRDVHELSDRVEQLNRRIGELTAESRPGARPAKASLKRKAATRKKTTRKTATRKKTTRKTATIKRKTSAKKKTRRRS